MVLTKDVALPTDEELAVPTELRVNTAALKTIATLVGKACEKEATEFMLKRSELEDPRKTIPEGKKLTACWVDIMKNLQLKCAKEVDKAVQCVEHNNCRQETLPCFKEMSVMDECAKTKLGLIRPAPGYFSTPMVYYGDRPKPQPVFRDYQKEAKDAIEEMPEEYHLKKDYKMWKEWNIQDKMRDGPRRY